MNSFRFTAFVLAAALPFHAHSQAWPAKPIRMLVGYAAGGVTDSAARLLADDISPRLGQPIIVENRGGASGQLAHDALKQSAPDGYTIELLTTPTVVATLLAGKEMTAGEMTGIAMHYDGPFPIIASTSAPFMASVRNIQDLIAVVKANPGKVNYTSAGTGSTGHLLAESIAQATGMQWTHIGYKGLGLAAADVLSGRVAVVMSNLPNDAQFMKEGKLRALGTSGLTRLPSYDAPSLGEQGLGNLAMTSWGGFVGPRGTPSAVVLRLSQEFRTSLSKPDLVTKISAFNPTPMYQGPDVLEQRLREDIQKFQQIIRRANIKVE